MKRFHLTSFRLVIALSLVLVAGLSLVARTSPSNPDDVIAFLRLTRGYWQVWLMNGDGTNSRQLTTSLIDKESPSWCPGNHVIHYYTSFGVAMLFDVVTGVEQMQEPLLPPIPPPQGPDGELLELPTDLRTTLRKSGFADIAGLTCGDPENATGETILLTASDSLPAGKAIAVQRRPAANPERLFELKLVDMANSLDYGRFRSDGKPASTDRVLSANGTLAFVTSGDGKSEVWIQAGTQEIEQLTHLGSSTAHPSWSLDGQWLVFESDFQGTPQIYRLALARRGTLERLTNGSTPSRHPVFRPPVGDER